MSSLRGEREYLRWVLQKISEIAKIALSLMDRADRYEGLDLRRGEELMDQMRDAAFGSDRQPVQEFESRPGPIASKTCQRCERYFTLDLEISWYSGTAWVCPSCLEKMSADELMRCSLESE